MKKKTLIIIGIILLITIPLAVNFLLKINTKKITDGTYYAVNCEEYPDAYVVVKGDTLQFYNIDLNAIYQKDQLNSVYKAHNNENLSFRIDVTEEELLKLSDLNDMFVNNSCKYDLSKGWKNGTFVYSFRCVTYHDWFGLYFLYDTWNRTITINNYQLQITFKRK